MSNSIKTETDGKPSNSNMNQQQQQQNNQRIPMQNQQPNHLQHLTPQGPLHRPVPPPQPQPMQFQHGGYYPVPNMAFPQGLPPPNAVHYYESGPPPGFYPSQTPPNSGVLPPRTGPISATAPANHITTQHTPTQLPPTSLNTNGQVSSMHRPQQFAHSHFISPPQSSQQQQPVPPPPPTIQVSNSQSSSHAYTPSNASESSRKRSHSGPPPSRATTTYPRKRALTACDMCRLKKIKCDNVRPRCGSCVKNGNSNCHYRTDDQQKDYSSYDPASLNILTKLDVILKDIKSIKAHAGLDNEPKPRFQFDKCIWDMSVTSIFKWRSFLKELDDSPKDIERIQHKLLDDYDKHKYPAGWNESLHDRFVNINSLERFLSNCFSDVINSFFVNCYSKIPVIDTFEFFDILERYQYFQSKLPNCSFLKLLEIVKDETQATLPPEIVKIYEENKIQIDYNSIRQFYRMIRAIPLILVVCAIGVISTPVELENLSNYANSKEEANSLKIGCIDSSTAFEGVPKSFPRERVQIASKLVSYTELLTIAFPFLLQPNTLLTVQYYLLLSQYSLYIMSPLLAYRQITTASQHMMYFLKKTNDEELSQTKRESIDRLFWSCLKLECELSVELSPFVPLSGITQTEQPSSFPKIPDPLSEELRTQYKDIVVRLAQKYDDEYTWYYFLTEIAVRKVDNKMFDEIYSLENSLKHVWDSDEFSQESAWMLFIKYLNQYNGIINSLSPEIRNFILQETEVEQIFKSMKKKFEKRTSASTVMSESEDFSSLDDFIIDDDILLRTQSECIMFIKTRVLTSKLLLFRPLVYLFLEDRIPLTELIDAAISVIPQTQSNFQVGSFSSFDTPGASSTSALSDNLGEVDFEIGFFNLIQAPQFYQKQYPDEDFSDEIEYITKEKPSEDNTPLGPGTAPSPGDEEDQTEPTFRIKNMTSAKARILRIFVQNLISLPKLNLPRLGAHRHPGSWYYLRNLFIANIFQFLIYKKLQEMLAKAENDPQIKLYLSKRQQQETSAKDLSPGSANSSGNSSNSNLSPQDIFGMLNGIVSKESLVAGFEHSVILFGYWKDEIPDCEIYQNYIKRVLKLL
ncbi:ZCF27 [[Candida] subhashii]|uniref:ZCF27 n=1 Tax=[Candida] subhashii TaxID=561895 RepID=A0A8J5USI0_9ASCO|nr:ZCF27 [[Candida] subhashii]KAG7665267.1 ZCF27 [[Candida] subhashii]